MDLNKNYYNILGVTNQSSEAEIKKAYRKKANETHPDKHGGDDSAFKDINGAYQILGDKNKKQEYDTKSPHGKNYTPHQGFGFGFNMNAGFNDPFSSIFESFFNRGYSDFTFRKQREEFKEDLDIIINLDVDLKRIYENKSITIKYKRKVKCNDCNGTGFDKKSHSESCEVCDGKGRDIYGFVCNQCLGEGKIYTGTCTTCKGEKVLTREQDIILDKTASIRQSVKSVNRGFGHHSKFYRERVGSLIANINFIPNPDYEIRNYDLHHTLNVHFQDAIDGEELIYNHIDDSKIKVKLPEKTKEGEIIRLKHLGLLDEMNNRGDLYIKVNIIIDYDRIRK